MVTVSKPDLHFLLSEYMLETLLRSDARFRFDKFNLEDLVFDSSRRSRLKSNLILDRV